MGSSTNLSKRFSQYFSLVFLKKYKGFSRINRALLLYSYSNFILEILEYCDPLDAIKREQYYLDLLKPEYNILKVAGSPLGYKHNDKALAKMRNRKLSEEQLANLREHLAKHNASPEQRQKSGERIRKLNATKGFAVEVINIETHETIEYDSIRLTAKGLNSNKTTISNYIQNQKLFGGKYQISIKKS